MASVTGTNYEYNEITHSNNSHTNGIDPMYHWDTHFPSRISQLTLNQEFSSPGPACRRKGRGRNRTAARYKTQPITFDEIKEVDEDTPVGGKSGGGGGQAKEEKDSGLKSQFTAFSRSMDGLLPALKSSPALMRDAALTVRPKERQQTTTSRPDPSSRVTTSESTASANTACTDQGNITVDTSGGDQKTSRKESGDTSGVVQPSQQGVEAIPAGLPTSDPNRHRRRQRKRGEPKRNKSIEEAPELDAITAAAAAETATAASDNTSITNKG